jgi:hypothetical protein
VPDDGVSILVVAALSTALMGKLDLTGIVSAAEGVFNKLEGIDFPGINDFIGLAFVGVFGNSEPAGFFVLDSAAAFAIALSALMELGSEPAVIGATASATGMDSAAGSGAAEAIDSLVSTSEPPFICSS